MEQEGGSSCCCSLEEAALHRQDVLLQLLRQRESRYERTARFLSAALLLLLAGVLALLVTVLLGGRGPSADRQPMMQPSSHSSEVSVQQQQKASVTPRAMLTAPVGKNVCGEYLEWESNIGHAFCDGGFTYSNGNLTVPRKGLYRVFLQITYQSNNNCECSDEVRLSNTVLHIRMRYHEIVDILSSVDSVNCSMKRWSKTLYTSGLFTLEDDSILFVKSTHPELIVESETKVFFGAELLCQ